MDRTELLALAERLREMARWCDGLAAEHWPGGYAATDEEPIPDEHAIPSHAALLMDETATALEQIATSEEASPVQTDECGFHAEQRKRLERELAAALKRAEEAEQQRNDALAQRNDEGKRRQHEEARAAKAEQAADRRLALLRDALACFDVPAVGPGRWDATRERIRAEISASTPAP